MADNILSDFGINILEEEIDDVIFLSLIHIWITRREEVSSVRCLSDVDRRAECMVWRSRTSACLLYTSRCV